MTTAENPYAGQGPVLLDVGGDVGALLVTMPASLEGAEIEIRSSHPDSHRPDSHRPDSHRPESHQHSLDDGGSSHVTHVAVLPRPTPAGLVHCVVFPSLLQGLYELYERPSGPVRLQVTIKGGQVTQTSWPS
jgi:hypothetical protein